MTAQITHRKLKVQPTLPYDEEVAAEICSRIAQGEGMESICEDEHLPSVSTVRRWQADEPPFRTAYARAREQQMQKWADDCVNIADDSRNDFIDRINRDESVDRVVDQEHIQRTKLRIDTRFRLMAKFAPRTFGDKVEVELSGSVKLETMSDAALNAKTIDNLEALGVDVATIPLLMPATVRPGSDGDDD